MKKSDFLNIVARFEFDTKDLGFDPESDIVRLKTAIHLLLIQIAELL